MNARIKKINLKDIIYHGLIAESFAFSQRHDSHYIPSGKRIYCGYCGNMLLQTKEMIRVPHFSVTTLLRNSDKVRFGIDRGGIICGYCPAVIFKNPLDMWAVIDIAEYCKSQKFAINVNAIKPGKLQQLEMQDVYIQDGRQRTPVVQWAFDGDKEHPGTAASNPHMPYDE